MEQLNKASYASNTVVIVPSKEVDLKNEHEMVVGWDFNHTLLQYKLMSCKHIKHIGLVSIIFLMLSLLMFSTWMVMDLVRCERVQVANNMLSIFMVVLQLIMMQQVHRTEFKDKRQVGRCIPHLITG
jgi:ABC-type Na+ efflux pump permease subunit